MFLLALIAVSVLALGFSAFAIATGSKAAIRAADREGMPAKRHTNHPAHVGETRLANDASSPSVSAGVSPASESDDLETSNTTADATVCNTTHTHSLPPSASPTPSRGLALEVSHDRTGQPCLTLPREKKAFGLDLSSRTASPRPRIKCGDAGRRRATSTTTNPALN